MGLEDPEGLRRWSLAARDRRAFYARYGVTRLCEPDIFMERRLPRSV